MKGDQKQSICPCCKRDMYLSKDGFTDYCACGNEQPSRNELLREQLEVDNYLDMENLCE